MVIARPYWKGWDPDPANLISPLTIFEARFTKLVDAATLNNQTVLLYDETLGPRTTYGHTYTPALSLVASGNDCRIVIEPDTELMTDHEVTVEITDLVRYTDGTPVGPESSTFSVYSGERPKLFLNTDRLRLDIKRMDADPTAHKHFEKAWDFPTSLNEYEVALLGSVGAKPRHGTIGWLMARTPGDYPDVPPLTAKDAAKLIEKILPISAGCVACGWGWHKLANTSWRDHAVDHLIELVEDISGWVRAYATADTYNHGYMLAATLLNVVHAADLLWESGAANIDDLKSIYNDRIAKAIECITGGEGWKEWNDERHALPENWESAMMNNAVYAAGRSIGWQAAMDWSWDNSGGLVGWHDNVLCTEEIYHRGCIVVPGWNYTTWAHLEYYAYTYSSDHAVQWAQRFFNQLQQCWLARSLHKGVRNHWDLPCAAGFTMDDALLQTKAWMTGSPFFNGYLYLAGEMAWSIATANFPAAFVYHSEDIRILADGQYDKWPDQEFRSPFGRDPSMQYIGANLNWLPDEAFLVASATDPPYLPLNPVVIDKGATWVELGWDEPAIGDLSDDGDVALVYRVKIGTAVVATTTQRRIVVKDLTPNTQYGIDLHTLDWNGNVSTPASNIIVTTDAV